MSLFRSHRFAWSFLAGVLAAVGLAAESQQPAKAPTDLDDFMARVLERRDQTWKTLHDYVLDESERFDIRGPADIKLQGMERQFTWYVREGYLVRSPVRFNGVTLSEAERRRYEERWLRDEKTREARRREAAKTKAGQAAAPETGSAADARRGREGGPPLQPDSGTKEGAPSIDTFFDQRGEPRFVSEAYFLRFKFDPGNYYFVGRERVEGREVVRVEYYPTRLFSDDKRDNRPATRKKGGEAVEDDINRNLNKVALITLWIDEAEQQIVRYTFDNVDFGFLPGRWLVRLDKVTASMTMGNVFEGVWLPKQVTMQGSFMLASGTYSLQYTRDFSNYKKAETRATIRGDAGAR